MLEFLNRQVTFKEVAPHFLMAAIILAVAGFTIYYIVKQSDQRKANQKKYEDWKKQVDELEASIQNPAVYRWGHLAVIFNPNTQIVHLRYYNRPNSDVDIEFSQIVSVERAVNGALSGIRLTINDLAKPTITIPFDSYMGSQQVRDLYAAFETVLYRNQTALGNPGQENDLEANNLNQSGFPPKERQYSNPYSASTSDTASNKPKNKGCFIAVLIVIGIFGIAFLASLKDESSDPHAESSSSDSRFSLSNSSAEPEAEPIVYETELICGNYIAGIDFPAGTYDITAQKGSGNISSDNMFSGGINALMGEKGSSDMYQQEYSNISLPDGTKLKIGSDLVVKIHSDEASGEALSERNQSITETVTLSNGHFTSGKDFEPGTYDITCTSGSGNISSDNMFDGGINEVMGYKKDGYIEKAYHIELPEDTILTVDGIKITMTPSK